jgi:hypothetical protein
MTETIESLDNGYLTKEDRMPHTTEYVDFQRALRDFQRALRDSCEEMLPERFPPQRITKLNPPCQGVTI